MGLKVPDRKDVSKAKRSDQRIHLSAWCNVSAQ